MKYIPYIFFHGILLAVAAIMFSFKRPASFDCSTCKFNGHQMWGKVQVVTAFPDVKVQVVTAFPDIKVQEVTAFPDACGKWQFVTAFPDVKIQYVTAFPDVKVQMVTAFPGCK